MDLWSRVRSANNEQPRRDATKLPHLVRALFTLEASSDARRSSSHKAFEDCLAFVGWEICHGQTLPILPDALHGSVDEYDLIVVLVPSVDVWHRHTTHLRTLSPDFPFLILLDGVASASGFKTQCPILSLESGTGDAVLPALLSLCDISQASGTCNARTIVEQRQYASLTLTQRQAAVLDVVWCGDDIRSEVAFSLTLAVDADEDVDGRYVGGLLKHILTSARIRLTEKRGHVAVRAPDVFSVSELSTFVSGTPLSGIRFTQSQVGSFLSDPVDGDIVMLCRQARSHPMLATRLHSCFPAYRLEVTSAFSAFVALSMLLDRSIIDNEICCRVEQISVPAFKPTAVASAPSPPPAPHERTSFATTPASVHQQQQQDSSHAVSPPRDLGRPPLVSSAATTLHQTPTRNSMQPGDSATASARPLPSMPPAQYQPPTPPPSFDADAFERMMDRKMESALLAQDQSNDAWRRAIEQRLASAELRCRDSEERNAVLESNMTSLHAFIEQRLAVVETAVKANEAQIQHLGQQLDLVRESAADHRLVESALNDIRTRSATLQGVKEAEDRVASIAQSVQRGTETNRLSIEALKGHMEALTIQHQQLAHRLESNRPSSELQHVLEDSLRRLDGRLAAVETGSQKTENDASVFHKAFEVGLNRLFEQLRLFHEDLSNIDGQVKGQSSRLDFLQNNHASMESSIARVVDEAFATGSGQRMEALHDQLTATKAYCVAAVERSSEMQSERVSDVEHKLAKDLQRAIDVLHNQHQSDVQRIQSSVEGHIKAQKQLMDELQMMSPARLAGSPRKEDLTLLREQLDHFQIEQAQFRERVKSIELLQADVSNFIGDDEKRRAEMDEVNLRLEELEASVQFIEARL